MSHSISPLARGNRLEDVVLEALVAARSRGPGTWPQCLVCSESMRVDEIAPGVLELTCDACGSSLSEDVDPPIELRLVS
jgi:hypothetical protein